MENVLMGQIDAGSDFQFGSQKPEETKRPDIQVPRFKIPNADNLESEQKPTFPAGDEKVTDGSDTEQGGNNNNLLMLLGVAFVGFLLFRRK